MKLVIAEKPSVAKSYAAALNVSVSNRGGYFEGGEYLITWCVGHLVKYVNPENYVETDKMIEIEHLPIIPREWKTEVPSDKRNQYKVVKELMLDKRVDEIVCGTDAGREGELIFRHVYKKSGCKKPVKRLWVSSMEDKALKEGFAKLKDGKEYDNLYMASLCRSQTDWLIGFNTSILFGRMYRKRLNMGRVKTPTLEMLRKRLFEINNFVKSKYFNAHLIFPKGEGVIEKIVEMSEAERIKSDCDGKTATVTSVKSEKKTVAPPKLYDLTTLQREANRIYGYSAKQTLDYVQSLYEMKLCTYPRTDSKYITADMENTAKNVIALTVQNIPHFAGYSYNASVKRVINDGKVTDHHAIIPTAEIAKADFGTIPSGEKSILFLVACKLICATSDNYVYDSQKAEIECGGHVFTAYGSNIIAEGWKEAERKFKEYQKCNPDEESEVESDGTDKRLDVKEGETFDNCGCNITEHWTSPPAHYTEDTLLKAMERAGADEVTEEVERSGLGTPATRAGIIEEIIQQGYAKRDKKKIICTELGIELLDIAPDILKSASYTAELEDELARISQGKIPHNQFMGKVEGLISDIIKAAKEGFDANKVSSVSGGKVIGKCPRCGKDVFANNKGYVCSDKDGCGFALWKDNPLLKSAGKELTEKIAVALITDGRIKLGGLKPKEEGKKEYSATVVLNDSGKYVSLNYDFGNGGDSKGEGNGVFGKCPICGNDVLETSLSYKCSNPDCKIILWKENNFLKTFKKELTPEIAAALLKDSSVKVKGLWSKRTGKLFNATVILTEEGKLELEF